MHNPGHTICASGGREFTGLTALRFMACANVSRSWSSEPSQRATKSSLVKRSASTALLIAAAKSSSRMVADGLLPSRDENRTRSSGFHFVSSFKSLACTVLALAPLTNSGRRHRGVVVLFATAEQAQRRTAGGRALKEAHLRSSSIPAD